MKKKILIIICLVVIVSTATFFYGRGVPSMAFRCPESYPTYEEYSAAVDEIVNQEVIENPSMSAQELFEKRYALLEKNNCTQTIQNLKEMTPFGDNASKADVIDTEMKTYNEATSSAPNQ